MSDFQQIIDVALEKVSYTHSRGAMHFPPVGEEHHQKQIKTLLENRPSPPVGDCRVHVGVAGAFNFTIAAQTRPDRILLLDMNLAQMALWQQIIQLLDQCETPAAFVAAYTALAPDVDIRPHGKLTDQGWLTQENWIRNPADYAYLRSMAQQGHMATAVLDVVHDAEASKILGSTLRDAGMKVDTCYWSNVASFIQPHRQKGKKKLLSSKKEGVVFNDDHGNNKDGLIYPASSFYPAKPDREFQRDTWKWDGKSAPAIVPEKGARAFVLYRDHDVPLYEHLLRNISAIGAEPHTIHMMARTYGRDGLVVTDGPPRHLQRIAEREALKRQQRPDPFQSV